MDSGSPNSRKDHSREVGFELQFVAKFAYLYQKQPNADCRQEIRRYRHDIMGAYCQGILGWNRQIWWAIAHDHIVFAHYWSQRLAELRLSGCGTRKLEVTGGQQGRI